MDEFDQVIGTANKVLNSPGFTGYFGININPFGNRFIPGTDAASTSALVDTLKSQGFMANIHKMKGNGSLSNAEGQKVMDAIGSLSSGQSEKSARAAIKTIIKTTEMAQKRMQQKYGKDMQPQQLSDDELINKYLGG
jgi:adenine-specific DNA methylase